VLLALIRYLPGSSGNLLYKALTLSEKTVIGDACNTQTDYRNKVNESQRFINHSLSFHTSNGKWHSNEITIISGHYGHIPFHMYESSNLGLIMPQHPTDLDNDIDVLYGSIFWKYIINISVSRSDEQKLLDNQRVKGYSLDINKEKRAIERLSKHPLMAQIKEEINFPYESFANVTLFLAEIKKINLIMGLALNLELVRKLYTEWSCQTIAHKLQATTINRTI